ncbi:probable E3 ubiquitin-protein ligase LUL3 [Euphorbia lathyris]|uniref:probable E3 ubiquitin-protein ligase LUL3 n=1 Tax=Euphorbia lathyris TaxID=212925 RepID=UPI00331443A5
MSRLYNRQWLDDPNHQRHRRSFPSTSTTTPSNVQLSTPTSQNTITPNSTNSNNTTLQSPSPPPTFAFAAHIPTLPFPSPSLSIFYNFTNFLVSAFLFGSSTPPNRGSVPRRGGYFTPAVAHRGWVLRVQGDSFTAARLGWFPRPSPIVVPVPPPCVHHSDVRKIKNHVNVHKDSIRLVVDDTDLNSYLVSFTFDALVHCSITVSYFATEGMNCTFMPLIHNEIYTPRSIWFDKGLGQTFIQPPGTGIDLGLFDLDIIHPKLSQGGFDFPLVICVDACLPCLSSGPQPPPVLSHTQITQAVFDMNNQGQFVVKVIKQILWIDQHRYEIGELYGLSNSENVSSDINGQKECSICWNKPMDTAILPCRHLCVCKKCGKKLWYQNENCPFCRQPIHKLLLRIKINEGQSDGNLLHLI